MTATCLSSAQWFVLWSLCTDNCPNPALVATVHAMWQTTRTEPTEPETTP